jgi:RimJ/RimL family protein N-acetyltransferase
LERSVFIERGKPPQLEFPEACRAMTDIVLPAGAVPTLETERLRLRGHRMNDLEPCAAMWADPLVTRHIGGRPFSREEVWSKILRYAGLWSLLGFGYWVAEDKATGEFLGEGGFADFKRDVRPSIEGMPEIGWALVPSAHGKGLATEAVRTVCAWGDSHFGGKPTVCMIDPENIASVWVAKKCGYQEFQRASYKDHQTVLYRR